MKKIIRYFIYSSIIIFSFALGGWWWLAHNHLVDFSILEQYRVGRASVLLDDEGNEWGRFELDRRKPVPLAQMPQALIHAFLASEDRQFFDHHGISYKGILRSVVVNMRYGRKAQGASTITQQLIRLLFFDARKTFARKIQEQLFALLVEHQYTKEQILQTYLNHVYFGCGIYGVAAASQRFFGIPVQQLSAGQAAALAAIVRCPGFYCPLLAPLSCQKRRDLILNLMATLGFITTQERDEQIAQPLVLFQPDKTVFAPHVKEALRTQLEELVGKKRLYTEGLVIQTTLNKTVQRNAQQQFSGQIQKLQHELPSIDGALICMEGATGEIKALVGGADFAQSKVNRALQARRQLGSVFKPLVYAVALEQGWNFAHLAVDEPIQVQQGTTLWEPRNSTRTFDGQMTLARALSLSSNIIAVKMLLNVGYEPVIRLAQQCHIQGIMHPYPSLALGCVDVTVREAVGCFNIFAQDGVYTEPHLMRWVKDEYGHKIWKSTAIRERVLPSRIAGQVTKVLSIGIDRYLRRNKHAGLAFEAIGKTGTTNDSRICWFAGASPEYTTVVCVAYDDNRSMGDNVFPIRTAFPIWLGLYEHMPHHKKTFAYDPSLKELPINWKTGLVTSEIGQQDVVSVFV